MTIMQNTKQGTEYTENQHNTPTVWQHIAKGGKVHIMEMQTYKNHSKTIIPKN
jgi:hypothetical protein